MNLPISLTLLRIFFVPLLVVLLLTKGRTMDLWAVGVFLAAAVTDLLDGYFARKHRQITTLGILLDPIADKLLTSGAFISLVELHLVPAWMVVIIVGREFAVSGLRAIASAEGFILQASDLGKTKMVLQVIAISTLVLEWRVPAVTQTFLGITLNDRWLYLTTRLPGYLLLWLVMLFAVASAGQYFWSFWKNLDVRLKRPARRLVILRPGEEKQLSEEREEKDVAAQ
jgi:CDP-diacylglycerol---glycerol-3-phosphate 3-phosphatidyltransferase